MLQEISFETTRGSTPSMQLHWKMAGKQERLWSKREATAWSLAKWVGLTSSFASKRRGWGTLTHNCLANFPQHYDIVRVRVLVLLAGVPHPESVASHEDKVPNLERLITMDHDGVYFHWILFHSFNLCQFISLYFPSWFSAFQMSIPWLFTVIICHLILFVKQSFCVQHSVSFQIWQHCKSNTNMSYYWASG